jgi:hypothetical protein
LNLGLLMRALVGVGTPRTLQGRLWTWFVRLVDFWRRLTTAHLPQLCMSAN